MFEQGDHGGAARDPQQELVDLGYEIDVDGAVGPVTRWVVRNVQADIDGFVGPATARLVGAQHGHAWTATPPNAQRWALEAQGLRSERSRHGGDPPPVRSG